MGIRAHASNMLVEGVWYGDSRWYLALLPASWLFGIATAARRRLYRSGILRAFPADVPVIVVGNIVSGGTGKTPVTLWLASLLKNEGFRPGIVSRGYGGRVGSMPLHVADDCRAEVVGDEPLLMARRAICPVVVHPDRVAAVATLVEMGCNVIIADDGLQHYRLPRQYEIAVVDGARGFGNGRLLPAGPLREPVWRLRTVDQVMLQGEGESPADASLRDVAVCRFSLEAGAAHNVRAATTVDLDAFRHRAVHAVAAIGNPRRFFRLLEAGGINIIPHAFPDHAALSPEDLAFDDDLDVIMTEKDAVKAPAGAPANWWYVPVNLKLLDPAVPDWLMSMSAMLKQMHEGSGQLQ